MANLGLRKRGRKGGRYLVLIETKRRYIIAYYDTIKDAKARASMIRRGYDIDALELVGKVSFCVLVERKGGAVIYKQQSVAERHIRKRYSSKAVAQPAKSEHLKRGSP